MKEGEKEHYNSTGLGSTDPEELRRAIRGMYF